MKATGVFMSTIRNIAALADKIIIWFVKGVCLLCFFLLFLLVFANVLIRINPFPELKVSLHYFDEVREWVLAAMIFYGAAGLWMLRDHFKLDVLNNVLFAKKRAIRALFTLFVELASFFFILVFTYASLNQVLNLIGETNDLRIPEKFIYLSGLLIPGLIMCIYALRNIAVCVRDLFLPAVHADDGGKTAPRGAWKELDMETREAVHPEHARTFDTEALRRHFLISGLFPKNGARLVYTYYDRLIVGGVSPEQPVSLQVDSKILGATYLLERRELGVINVGGPGAVKVDDRTFALAERDGLYVGRGSREIIFSSVSAAAPAKFYLNCVPAHEALPTAKMTFKDAAPLALGADDKSNKRTIYKYFHPTGIKTCQLVMGLTMLAPNNVWNTMPAHTHQRRMEAYFYFNLPEDGLVFQLLGEPSQTRHIVVRNEEAVLHPSWSIHSGVGTTHYAFIWGMAGENQTFTDMDEVPMRELR